MIEANPRCELRGTSGPYPSAFRSQARPPPARGTVKPFPSCRGDGAVSGHVHWLPILHRRISERDNVEDTYVTPWLEEDAEE
jgi:hypothetical protein